MNWWKMKRRIKNHILWVFGQKLYYVHRSGIIKVVIAERSGDLITYMGSNFMRFSTSKSAVYETMGEAIAGLVALHEREKNGIKLYWMKKWEQSNNRP